MLKYLFKKACLDWMKSWKVMEADLLNLDAVWDILTGLSSVSSKDQHDFLLNLLAKDEGSINMLQAQ